YIGRSARRSPRGIAALALKAPLIRWDRRAAGRADHYWANSTVVQTRINDVYGLASELLHPPSGIDATAPLERPQDAPDGPFHLLVARLLPYKNVDRVLAAYTGRAEQLLIVGDGPMREQLLRQAPPNVRFAHHLPDAQLRWCYAHAQVLMAASHEDFGLTILEAASYGTPAIALRAGGFLDTVREGETGVFFDEPTAALISQAIDHFIGSTLTKETVIEHAATFAEERFAARLREKVTEITSG
ncbi:MAG: glycosyltransferase, partial [Actinomycetota bacterium]|nr:glycosyltransferase [Actinomycetota bacterium]